MFTLLRKPVVKTGLTIVLVIGVLLGAIGIYHAHQATSVTPATGSLNSDFVVQPVCNQTFNVISNQQFLDYNSMLNSLPVNFPIKVKAGQVYIEVYAQQDPSFYAGMYTEAGPVTEQMVHENPDQHVLLVGTISSDTLSQFKALDQVSEYLHGMRVGKLLSNYDAAFASASPLAKGYFCSLYSSKWS